MTFWQSKNQCVVDSSYLAANCESRHWRKNLNKEREERITNSQRSREHISGWPHRVKRKVGKHSENICTGAELGIAHHTNEQIKPHKHEQRPGRGDPDLDDDREGAEKRKDTTRKTEEEE
jgi:hypothetical protein